MEDSQWYRESKPSYFIFEEHKEQHFPSKRFQIIYNLIILQKLWNT